MHTTITRISPLLALIACFFTLALSASSCAAEPAPAKSFKLVATTAMVADVVRNVAGDRAQVTLLMAEGVDPHLYKPTRADMSTLMSADAVFYNGLLLEGKMTDALIRLASSGKKVWAITEILDESDLLEPADMAGHADPHVWMDPVAWARTIDVVRDKLIELDPSSRPTYEANASTYAASLQRLIEYSQESLATVPEPQRALITAHDAFNYFGRRYGYEVVGIQGLSTESEASVRDIESLVELLVSRRIGAVFVESTVSSRNIEALIAGAKARGHTVTIGGELFSDAMGAPNTYEGTYIGMIDHNITTITRALGGTAPERGMDNKLAPPKH